MKLLIVESSEGIVETYDMPDDSVVNMEGGVLICGEKGVRVVVYATGRWNNFVFKETPDE